VKRVLLWGAVALAAGAGYVAWGIPSRSAVSDLARRNPGTTGVMRQRDEEARRARRTPRRQQSWVPIDRVSRHLVHAVLSSEDQKFFGHEGVDWEAIKKSAEEDRRKLRFVRGGSTITQQLAKNLFFTTHKSPVRKLRELVVTRWLETDLSKKRILELYLNVIEWGDGVYGVQAAAQRYYGKSAATLDASEAAGLAAMIPNPRRINPRVDPRRHARAQRRVLWLMANAGYLSRSGLGSEPPPPPEPVEEDDDDLPLESPEPPAPADTATPAPEPAATPAAPPSDAGTPSPGDAPPEAPSPSPLA
jgi:monofunctional glycosyltransferase